MPLFFFLFVSTTFTEIWVMIEVGRVIGSLPTIALMILTALAGALLLRQQGGATLLRARERILNGSLPAQEIVEGLVLAFGGALLLTPGFITDGVGLLCLIPYTRAKFACAIIKRFASGASCQGFHFRSQADASGATSSDDEKVIDGECRREDEKF